MGSFKDNASVVQKDLSFKSTRFTRLIAIQLFYSNVSFFFKSMGPAPKWCSFLDNLTEELEANPTSTG